MALIKTDNMIIRNALTNFQKDLEWAYGVYNQSKAAIEETITLSFMDGVTGVTKEAKFWKQQKDFISFVTSIKPQLGESSYLALIYSATMGLKIQTLYSLVNMDIQDVYLDSEEWTVIMTFADKEYLGLINQPSKGMLN